MNKDTEKKLDELLARLPKAEHDLGAWLEEDETAEFDHILAHQPRTNTGSYGQPSLSPRKDTDSYGRQARLPRRELWRWIGAAACLLIILGIGVTVMKTQQKPGSNPMVTKYNAQPLPSLQGKGLGVGSETSKNLSLEEETHAIPLPPSLEGRGVATPKREMPTPTRTVVTPRKKVAQVSQQDAIADTLGSGIWQREENVMTALQMLSECEQTIRREEQEVRNAVIEATYKAVPRPANVILVSDENGDYEVIERRAIIGI